MLADNLTYCELAQISTASGVGFGKYDEFIGKSLINAYVDLGTASDPRHALVIELVYGRDILCPSDEQIVDQIAKVTKTQPSYYRYDWYFYQDSDSNLRLFGYELARSLRRIHVQHDLATRAK